MVWEHREGPLTQLKGRGSLGDRECLSQKTSRRKGGGMWGM